MVARTIAILALAVLLIPKPARAQAPSWIEGPWISGPLTNAPDGANSVVEAFEYWDPDGVGPQSPRLVVGGYLTSIEGVLVNHIAARNPASGRWEPLGAGVDGDASHVECLTVFNGELIAGGDFLNAGGQPANYIARWDGSSWQPLGSGLTGRALCLAVYNGELIAGGVFSGAGGQPASNIARWDGTSWSPLGSGTNGSVWSIALYNGELVAGGQFTSAGGSPAQFVAAWNGSAWHPLVGGTGPSGAQVFRLAIHNGELVAGPFTFEGNTSVSLVRWNGTTWLPMGTIFTGGQTSIDAFAHYNGDFIAAVNAYSDVMGYNCFLARWNGSSWDALAGADDWIRCLAPLDDDLIAGGWFRHFCGTPVGHMARWNGSQCGPLGGGTVTGVFALTNYRGREVGGGLFQQSLTGQTANNIAAFDGVELSTFGLGMDNSIFALETFKYNGFSGDYELIAGGSFTQAGGTTANFIARWDEDPTDVFPPPAWQPMGAGFNNGVTAIKRHNGQTYAAGTFTFSSMGVNRIARWNEATDVWEPLGAGMNGAVFALESYGGYLYAGGQFTTAGGVSTGGLARWDGVSWSQVGGFFLGNVYALEVHEGQLVIGGQYPGINASPNLARYDGFNYSTFSTGGTDAPVRGLASVGNRLYIGGDFFSVGGVNVAHVAYWDGVAWYAAGGGPSGNVKALHPYQNEVHAGGIFPSAAGVISPGWARYPPTGLPWIAYNPVGQSASSGGDVAFTSRPASGYEGLTLQWHHYGIPLADGPSAMGSILGANEPTLHIANVSVPDAGPYTLVVSNATGADTSAAATLTVDGILGVEAPVPAQTTRIESLGPNPTNGSASLEFRLARGASVQARVHDVAGRVVRRFAEGHWEAGQHRVVWDGRRDGGAPVASGIYFVTLEVDGWRIGARRLVVMH